MGRPSLAGPPCPARTSPTRCYPLRSTDQPAGHASPRRSNPRDGGPQQIMAKRARGTTTRPGQRRPMQRAAARPAAPAPRVAPRPVTLTEDEEARAAELEAAIVAQEQASAETLRRGRPQRPTPESPARFSSLAVAAGNEYAYVARD